MTESANKASNSEITDSEGSFLTDNSMATVWLNMVYVLLNNNTSQEISSPVDGFINILIPTPENSCICPFFLKQQSYVLRGGENIILPIKRGEQLEWKNAYNNRAIALFIPENLLDDFKLKLEQNNQRFKNGLLTSSDNRIKLILNQIIDHINLDSYLNRLRIQALLIEVLVHQIEGLYAENEMHEIIPNKSHYDKIVMVKNLIHKDLSKNHTIPELAKYVGTNEQYLKKHFKQYFGKTVMNYITEQKMEHAKELILTGDYRVSDVARMTGYKHATHFTSAFKKYFGFIPNSLKYTFLIANEGAQILSDIEGIIGTI